MGLFRSGFLACLVVGLTTLAQQGVPAPGPGAPIPTPGTPVAGPDTNAPAPIVPQPEPVGGVDPNALQPIPAPADAVTGPTTGGAKAKTTKKPSAGPALPTLRGTVSAVDKTAMTVTIHGKSKDETLNVTSKTRIFADNKPAILADAKEGEKVVAEYRNTKEKAKEALTLRFGGPGAPEAKADTKGNAEEKHVKPAPTKKTTKSTKASSRKKKKPATDNAVPPVGTDSAITPLPDNGTPVPAPGAGAGTPVPAPGPGIPVPNPGTPNP